MTHPVDILIDSLERAQAAHPTALRVIAWVLIGVVVWAALAFVVPAMNDRTVCRDDYGNWVCEDHPGP